MVMKMVTSKRIVAYLGAGNPPDDGYLQMIERAGRSIAKAGLHLVYGGTTEGSMRILADSVLDSGGSVTGVFCRMFSRDLLHTGLTAIVEEDTISNRKHAEMEMADAYIVLPGGVGTMDELFEVLALGVVDEKECLKPIGLLNYAGYFDDLLNFFKRSINVGYAGQSVLDRITIASSPDELIGKLVKRM